jgi:hypothetical protein
LLVVLGDLLNEAAEDLAVGIELLVEVVEGEGWDEGGGGEGAPLVEENADGALGSGEEEEFRD